MSLSFFQQPCQPDPYPKNRDTVLSKQKRHRQHRAGLNELFSCRGGGGGGGHRTWVALVLDCLSGFFCGAMDVIEIFAAFSCSSSAPASATTRTEASCSTVSSAKRLAGLAVSSQLSENSSSSSSESEEVEVDEAELRVSRSDSDSSSESDSSSFSITIWDLSVAFFGAAALLRRLR